MYQYGARIIYKEFKNSIIDFFYIEGETIKNERILKEIDTSNTIMSPRVLSENRSASHIT